MNISIITLLKLSMLFIKLWQLLLPVIKTYPDAVFLIVFFKATVFTNCTVNCSFYHRYVISRDKAFKIQHTGNVNSSRSNRNKKQNFVGPFLVNSGQSKF